jgi:NAD(P)-dependent dehydrogenase (short-subunit alcohol dehydrogenase family)
MIEHLLTMKFDCSIQYSASDDATEIKVDNASVGLKPSTITLKNETNKLEIRLKHAALVTGAAVRLGKAIALTLAEQGYDIALHYNTGEEEAMKTATEIRSLGVNCSTFQYSFMDIKNIPNFIDHIINTYPYVDVLVNNASVYDSGTIMQTTDSMFDRQWTINFKAPFFLSKEFARHVKHGNIINMLDNKIFFNQFQYSAYLISKKALYEFTKMASIEFAPKIRVNAIAPGMILPPTERTIEYLEWRKQGIPLQKCGDVRDICAAIITLLTNTFINGHIMVVDGGESRNSTGRNVIAYNDGNI